MSDEVKDVIKESTAVSKFDLEQTSMGNVVEQNETSNSAINLEQSSTVIDLRVEPASVSAGDSATAPTHTPPPSTPPQEDLVEVVTSPASEYERRFPWLHVGVSIVSTALICLGLFTLFSDSLLGRIEVEDFVGMELTEVESALSGSSVVIETIEGRQDGTEAGEVIDQRPRQGSTVGPGDILLLTISEGSELAAIPGVAGLTMEEAQELVSARGFEVGEIVEERDSATVPQGSVIEVVVNGVAVDGDVPSGTVVDFVVSNGLVTIPRVTTEEIESVLIDRLGLVVQVQERFQNDATAGEVIETSPATGTKVTPGSTVTVVIALDEPQEQVNIPNVLGRSVFEAVGILDAAGFRPVLDTQAPDGNCNGRFAFASQECRRFNSNQVWQMNPRNDAFPGSEIRIFVSPDAANAFNDSRNN